MRRATRKGLTIGVGALGAGVAALAMADSLGANEPSKSSATERAQRRAYDGAPATIPHEIESAKCTECHTAERVSVPGRGYSPPSPHGTEAMRGSLARCGQCHLPVQTKDAFRPTTFVGLAQDLRRGPRQTPHSPPRVPHSIQMRENCSACHAGPAAREEIRTTHAERQRCQQCHLEIVEDTSFAR